MCIFHYDFNKRQSSSGTVTISIRCKSFVQFSSFILNSSNTSLQFNIPTYLINNDKLKLNTAHKIERKTGQDDILKAKCRETK